MKLSFAVLVGPERDLGEALVAAGGAVVAEAVGVEARAVHQVTDTVFFAPALRVRTWWSPRAAEDPCLMLGAAAITREKLDHAARAGAIDGREGPRKTSMRSAVSRLKVAAWP